jgi:hypothetical protein
MSGITEDATRLDSFARARRTAGMVLADIGGGIVAVMHSTLALVGFVVLLLALVLLGKSDSRSQVERELFGWLQVRHVARETPADKLQAEATPPGLVLDVSMTELPQEEKRVADWLSRRYRIAPDPMAHMVSAAYSTARTLKLDPHLVLAVAAIESSFNPFVQSGMGAQGLMQVMSEVHEEKFERFGGTGAAFDPVTSIRVGALILSEYVGRAGTVEGGLKMYVGATSFATEGGYGQRVLAERLRLGDVARGKSVPVLTQSIPASLIEKTQPAKAEPVDAKEVIKREDKLAAL